MLGGDGAPSDRLVVDGGTASGTTGMAIVQAGGEGEGTVRDGILVVEAANGARTDAGAFALANRVAAGAREYLLFRGGVSAGSEESWYLRSALMTPPVVPVPQPAPGPDPASPPEPEPQPELPETDGPAAALGDTRNPAADRRHTNDAPRRSNAARVGGGSEPAAPPAPPPAPAAGIRPAQPPAGSGAGACSRSGRPRRAAE